MKVDKFWMVFRIGQSYAWTGTKYDCEAKAAIAAEEAAQHHSGEGFVVLEAMRACAASGPVAWTDCE